jgi:hypothetical protein
MATALFSQESKRLTLMETQQLLSDQLYLVEIITKQLNHPEELLNINNLKGDISDLTENQVLVFPTTAIYEQVRSKLNTQITHVEALALNHSINKTVTLIDEKPLAACAGFNGDTVLLTLTNKFIADEILADSKWECLQTVLGENLAEGCTPLSIIVAVDDALFELGEFCRLNQNEAVTGNIFGNIRGISSDIFEYIDTEISDVNSQDQLNMTQDSTNHLNATLNENLPVFESDLTQALSRLDQTNNQLNVIFAQAESILTRVQISQIEIENLAIISADAQQQAIEIRQDTQTLLISTANLIIQIAAINQETQTKVKSAFTQQIEFALARSAKAAPLHFQLPLALGGQLELVREKLINNISTVESLGGKTAAVRKLLLLGDQAFNSSQYSLAYNNYSDAYKALLEVSF